MEAGVRTLREYDLPVEVQERTAPEQHWVGAVVTIGRAELEDRDAAGSDARRYDTAFGRLASALQAAGNPPVLLDHPPQRRVRAGGELVLCWPVAVPVGPGFTVGALRLESGTLPPRVECFVRLVFDAPDYPDAPGRPDR